ncbi:MAG: hypothetical protein IKH81_02310 [Clostridia bacterium]|nr:hypothetical protein [Clostridia bacterium]
MKKLLSLLLIACLAFTAIPALGEQGPEFYTFMNYRNRLGNEATLETLEKADENAPAAISTKYNIDTTTYERSDLLENFPKETCWVYRSANIYAGQASARNNTSFLVFAEKHFDGEDDVREYLNGLGLIELIDSVIGSVILFTPADPAAGFGEADLENYYNLHKSVYIKRNVGSSVPTADYEYMGTTGKIYFIGIDGGATFINNFVAPGDPECIGQTGGVLLVGGEMKDDAEISMYTPAYIVNGTEKAVEAWKKVNVCDTQDQEDGLDVYYNKEVPLRRVYDVKAETPDPAACVKDAFYKIFSQTQRESVISSMAQEMPPVVPWTDEVPVPELHRYALAPRNTIVNGVTLDGNLYVNLVQSEDYAEYKTMYDQYLQTWYEAIPEDVVDGNAPEGSVPVIIALHGTGDDPLMFMDEIGALEVAGREHCAILCPFQEELVISHEGAKVTMGVPIYEGIMDKALPLLLEKFLSEYPALDRTRVYVLGYSMGGGSVYRAMYGCMEKIAAAVPMAGMHPDMFYASTEEQDARMKEIGFPLMELTSTFDLGFDRPNSCLNENTMTIYKKYAALNGIEYADGYDYEASPYFGLPYDDFSVSTLMGEFRTFKWVAKNADGIPVMGMSCTENTTHSLYPMYSELAWNFFKEFSRDPETGKIVYTPAE